jgi:hypothetical protein
VIETIRSLPLALFIAIMFFPLVLAAVLIGAGLQARRRAALITATETANIGMAQDGYREFEGRAEAIGGEAVPAGLTGWPCVWYRATVEKFSTGSGSNRTSSWSTVRSLTSNAPFFVRDSTGVCLVEPWGAEVTPTDKSVWYGATEKPADRNPAKVGPSESARGMVEVGGGPNSKYRYSEERIYAGDPLLVLGEFTTGRHQSAFDADGEDENGEDEDGEAEDDDGIDDDSTLSEEEREDIAADERAEALRARGEDTTKAWIGRGSGRQPFILSTTLQAIHVAQSSMGAQAALTGAAVPAVIALFLLWARFG